MLIPEITLLVCVYNEEDNIFPFLDEAIPTLKSCTESFEILFINDGSKDNTIERIKKYPTNVPIRIINFSRNFGKEVALTAGLDYSKGKAVIPIDVDLQLPLNTIPIFIEKWKHGYLNVIGIRKNRDYEGRVERTITHWFYKIIDRISNIQIIPNAGDYRLLDRKVVEEIKKMREHTRFMKGIFSYPGFTYTTVTYEIKKRERGTSKWSFWKLWNFSLDGIFGFTTIPLRVWSYFGFTVCLVSFIYALLSILKTLISGVDTPGYTTTIVFILFFGGIQLISVGVLGEYIGRIFDQVKQRPLYIVDNEIILNNEK